MNFNVSVVSANKQWAAISTLVAALTNSRSLNNVTVDQSRGIAEEVPIKLRQVLRPASQPKQGVDHWSFETQLFLVVRTALMSSMRRFHISRSSEFCVDNVNPFYSEDDVVPFVTNLHVTIVSCYEVKPRWRYFDSRDEAVLRKAFRLCTLSEDCDRLLDANKATGMNEQYCVPAKKNTTLNMGLSWPNANVLRFSISMWINQALKNGTHP